VKTTYPKTVTEKIIEYWGLGFSASETKDALLTEQQINIGLNTIYKHRHSLDGQNLIDQLINKQLRDILSQRKDNPELSMRYRNELLKILVPVQIETTNKNLTISQTTVKHVVELVDPANCETPDTVQTA